MILQNQITTCCCGFRLYSEAQPTPPSLPPSLQSPPAHPTLLLLNPPPSFPVLCLLECAPPQAASAQSQIWVPRTRIRTHTHKCLKSILLALCSGGLGGGVVCHRVYLTACSVRASKYTTGCLFFFGSKTDDQSVSDRVGLGAAFAIHLMHVRAHTLTHARSHTHAHT